MELLNFDNLMATLEEYAQEVRNEYQDRLITNDRIASGQLLNSIEYGVNYNGVEYVVTLTLEKYWKYLEYGLRGKENPDSPFPNPGWKAYPAILEWVKVKPVLPRPNQVKIRRPEQLAGAIVAAMAKNGTQPGKEMKSALFEVNERFKDKIVIALRKDLDVIMKVMVGGIFGNVPTYERREIK